LRQESLDDGQHSVGEGVVVGGEEDEGARDVGGFADTAHRVQTINLLQVLRATRLFGDPLHALGSDLPGSDGVDADSPVSPLDR
jgi:hypothetical protein